MGGPAVTDDGELSPSLGKILLMAGQFSNLLTTDYSAEMTDKNQDGRPRLPQCRKVHGRFVLIVGRESTKLINVERMLGHITLLFYRD